MPSRSVKRVRNVSWRRTSSLKARTSSSGRWRERTISRTSPGCASDWWSSWQAVWATHRGRSRSSSASPSSRTSGTSSCQRISTTACWRSFEPRTVRRNVCRTLPVDPVCWRCSPIATPSHDGPLAPYAALEATSRGRRHAEPPERAGVEPPGDTEHAHTAHEEADRHHE